MKKDGQKVILRFLDGKMLKGFVKDFSVGEGAVFIEDESSNAQKIRLKDLKAIFFVRKFEGDKGRREKKSFSGSKSSARRLFVRFKDGESMTGYLEGDAPWRTGFFLESVRETGFFMVPTDEESNNVRIFVVTSAVRDVAMIGG